MPSTSGLRLVSLALAATGLAFAQGATAYGANYLNTPDFDAQGVEVNRCGGKITGRTANNWDDNSDAGCSGTGYTVTYQQDDDRVAGAPATPTSPHSQKIVVTGTGEARLRGFSWLFSGHRYKASIWLRASADREVKLSLRRDSWPLTEYAVSVVKVGTAWKQYTFEGLAPNDASGQTGAWMTIIVDKPGTVWADDASVVSELDPQNVATAPTTAVPKDYFGLHVLRDKDLPNHQVGGFLDRNIGLVRLWDSGPVWLNINPSPGVWNWDLFEERVSFVRSHGAEPLMVLGGLIPRWAAAEGDRDKCNFYDEVNKTNTSSPPSDIETWKTWVRGVAEHAKGKVRYFEIWNEPYMCEGFNDRLPFLAQMEAEAIAILKAADPNNVVLTPTMPPWGNDYVDRYFAAGGGRYADGLAVHLYDNYLANHLDTTHPYEVGYRDSLETLLIRDRYMDNLKLVLNRYGRANLPVWDTESGYSMRDAACGTQQESKALAYVARRSLLNWIAGVKHSFYYGWDLHFARNRDGTCYTNAALGRETENEDGGPYFVTPSGKAYEQMAKWITGAVVSAPQILPNNNNGGTTQVWAVKVKRGPTTSYIAWNPNWTSTDTKLPTYPLPSPKLQRRTDLAGAVTTVSGNVAVTASPVLFTAPPLGNTFTSQYGGLRQGWDYANTLTVTLTGGAGPTGYVQFQIDGINLGAPVALANGVAKLTTRDIDNYPVAWHTLSANYLGDEYHAAVTLPVTKQIRVCPNWILESCPQ